jgi:hypothetical protein
MWQAVKAAEDYVPAYVDDFYDAINDDDAGRALAERVACLEEVAEKALGCFPERKPEQLDALRGALARLDALRGGAK